MSDFINRFWSDYVAVVSLLSILGCVILLWLTARKRIAASADNTTGHVWDEDLREANNPLPMWWVGLFVLTIVFGLGYLAVFPGLGSFRGQSDWSSRGEYEGSWQGPCRSSRLSTQDTPPCPSKRSRRTRRPRPSASGSS